MPKVVQFARYHHLPDFDQCRQRNHGFVSTTHKDLLNIVRRGTAARVGLYDHIVLLAFTFVACHLASTEHRLDGARNQIHTDPHVRRALPIDLQFDFRFIQSQIGIDLNKTRVFGQLVLKRAHGLRQILVAVGRDDDEINRPLGEPLPERWWRDGERRHTRQTGHPGRHFTRHV